MASTTEDGAFEANFPDNKLTLFLTQVGGRVLRVTFHDTSSWCHETSWICTLIPDKYSPHINHHKFRQRLSALKEQFATHGRLTSIQFDRWMFVFGHETEDIADDMLGRYTSLKEIILKFIQEFDARVTDITMKSESMKVDAAAARKDQGNVTYTGMTGNSKAEDSLVAGQVNTGNTNINISLYLKESSGEADYQTNWETTNDIPQRPFIDFENLATRLKRMFNAILLHVRMGCMVFCFEHESKEDAINMIIRHAEVKEVILHFLQELDPSIQDIRMKVEFRELCQAEEQTADTSETRPRGMTDPEHKGEEGTSRSHPQQKDVTSHLHIQETGDDSSSLSHSPQKKKKYEDTCLPHPQETEEDKTSLQQTDEDTSHLQHQEEYVKDKFKYQPIKIEKGSGSHSSGYTSSDPNLKPLVKGQDSDQHATPPRADYDLFYASMAGDLEKVKRLLSTPGVDINCRVWSQTPVMTAAWRGHRKVVELLVNEGADVSLVDKFGNNILHFACMGGDVETVEFVLSLNVADINSIGEGSWTPVIEAAWMGHRKVVELLVSEGADVSLVDKFGNIILHRACMGGDFETVEFVLSLNMVDIDARDKWGETPADKARLWGHQRVVELLKSRGAQ